MSERIDFDEPFEEVVGPGFSAYRYMQAGKFFDRQGVRVNEDGSFWTDRERKKEEEAAAIQAAGKADPALKGVALAAKKGFKLPARLTNEAAGRAKR